MAKKHAKTRYRGVYRRGRSIYYATYTVDPETGERRQKQRTSHPVTGKPFDTPREAHEAKVEEELARSQGTFVEPSTMTVREWVVDHWLPAQEAKGLKETTTRQYRINSKAYVVPQIGGVKLRDVDSGTLSRLYGALLSEGRRDGKGGLAAKSVRNVATMLHTVFRDAARQGLMARNPCADVEPPRVDDDEMRYWTPEQLRAFLDHVAGDRLEALWFVFATTGMRRGEVLGLRWSDVDLDRGVLSVRQSITTYAGSTLTSSPKNRKGRRLALDAATVEKLGEHAARQTEELEAWGDASEDSGLVFTKENGEGLRPAQVSRLFRRLSEEAELPRIRLHDLRHSYAVAALESGEHPKVVSERLGHANVQITLDTYSHVVPGLDEAAAERVAGVILGRGGPHRLRASDRGRISGSG